MKRMKDLKALLHVLHALHGVKTFACGSIGFLFFYHEGHEGLEGITMYFMVKFVPGLSKLFRQAGLLQCGIGRVSRFYFPIHDKMAA